MSIKDEYSLGTKQDLLISGLITRGVGVVLGITGLVVMPGATKTETITSPAAASVQASKPRILPSGTFVF